MGELEEFAEALLDQLSIEINEEKEIAKLSEKIAEDSSFSVKFPQLEDICEQIFPQTAKKIQDFIGIPIFPSLKLNYSTLDEFKKLKGKKVFANEDGINYVDDKSQHAGVLCPAQVTTLYFSRMGRGADTYDGLFHLFSSLFSKGFFPFP